jgi:hypothetical protein
LKIYNEQNQKDLLNKSTKGEKLLEYMIENPERYLRKKTKGVHKRYRNNHRETNGK